MDVSEKENDSTFLNFTFQQTPKRHQNSVEGEVRGDVSSPFLSESKGEDGARESVSPFSKLSASQNVDFSMNDVSILDIGAGQDWGQKASKKLKGKASKVSRLLESQAILQRNTERNKPAKQAEITSFFSELHLNDSAAKTDGKERFDVQSAVSRFENEVRKEDKSAKGHSESRPLETESLRRRASVAPGMAARGFQLDRSDWTMTLDGEYRIDKDVFDRLFPYQREAVAWLWGLYRDGVGGILGDDMGLGKTAQTLSFLQGLFQSSRARTVLIVAPLSLLEHWAKEAERWCPAAPYVGIYHGGGVKQREHILVTARKKGGIILTTYHTSAARVDELKGFLYTGPKSDSDTLCPWDMIVLDEGHKIKNPTIKAHKALKIIAQRTPSRLLLSGTPVQNNLEELWALFDFACSGRLLGDAKTFKTEFASTIVRGSHRNAQVAEKKAAEMLGRELRALISPFFLRREKKTVIAQMESSNQKAEGLSDMGKKSDVIVWLSLTPLQKTLYQAFLESPVIREALNKTKSPLSALTVLKKICDDPRMLTSRALRLIKIGEEKRQQKGGESSEEETDESDSDLEQRRGRRAQNSGFGSLETGDLFEEEGESGVKLGKEDDEDAWDPWLREFADLAGCTELISAAWEDATKASVKHDFLNTLLPLLRSEGHRTLVFSQSKKMLSETAALLRSHGLRFLRIDGDISSREERMDIVNKFNTDPSYDVCLLTTQVGGLGLTLNGADRVVIVDPAWNPAVDDQAVDRAYRIGQRKDVVVYRLITCGTVEEKIYRKQVFKGGLMRTLGKEAKQFRYFTSDELSALFRLDRTDFSETHEQIRSVREMRVPFEEDVRHHINEVESWKRNGVVTVSNHSGVFQHKPGVQAGDAAAMKAQVGVATEADALSPSRVKDDENEHAQNARDRLGVAELPSPFVSRRKQAATFIPSSRPVSALAFERDGGMDNDWEQIAAPIQRREQQKTKRLPYAGDSDGEESSADESSRCSRPKQTRGEERAASHDEQGIEEEKVTEAEDGEGDSCLPATPQAAVPKAAYISVTKAREELSETETKEYDRALKRMNRYIQKENATAALEAALDALSLSDDDEELQRLAVALGEELGFGRGIRL